MTRACRALVFTALAGGGLIAGDSQASPVDQASRLVGRLGADSVEEREASTAELKKLLLDLDAAKDGEAIRRVARLLRGAAEKNPDAEVQERLDQVLSPFKAGSVQWMRKPGDGDIQIQALAAEGKWVVAGGAVAGQRKGQPPPAAQGWLGALDPATGNPVWEHKPGTLPGSVAIVRILGNRVAAGGPAAANQAWLGLYDAGSGKVIWERKTGELPGGSLLAVAAQGATLWAGGTASPGQGWLTRCSLDDGVFEANGRFNLPGDVRALLIRGKNLYAGGECAGQRGWIGCYEQESGRLRWSHRNFSDFPGACQFFCAEGKRLAAGGSSPGMLGWTAGYDLEDGKTLWENRSDANAPRSTSALISDGSALYRGGSGNAGGWLERAAPDTGKAAWTRMAPDLPGIAAALQPQGNLVLAGGQTPQGRGWLDGLDPATGKTAWSAVEAGLTGPVRFLAAGGNSVFAAGFVQGQAQGWLACVRSADAWE